MVLQADGISKIRCYYKSFFYPPTLPLTLLLCNLGLLKDDIIDDEHEVVQEAIRRLPEQAQFDRMFRLKRAIQVHINRDVLPTEEWTRPEKVILLSPPQLTLSRQSCL